MLVAIAVMATIFPFRTADKAEEVAEVQRLVDGMSTRMTPSPVVPPMSKTSPSRSLGSLGSSPKLPAACRRSASSVNPGTTASSCTGPRPTSLRWAGWFREDCDPDSIAEVPIRPNGGYIPGTGPPFDVTPLVYKARTPFWFLGALVLLLWIIIKATLDLFLIALRPDYFFSKDWAPVWPITTKPPAASAARGHTFEATTGIEPV